MVELNVAASAGAETKSEPAIKAAALAVEAITRVIFISVPLMVGTMEKSGLAGWCWSKSNSDYPENGKRFCNGCDTPLRSKRFVIMVDVMLLKSLNEY